MQNQKGLLDIKVFVCKNCKIVTYQTVVTECCELIICRTCITNNIKCPKCQTLAKYKKSLLLQQIQRNLLVQCPYDCNTQLSFFQVQKHMTICPEATTSCPFCKLSPKVRLIPEHLGESHLEQCNRLLNQFQKLKEGGKVQVEPKQEPIIPKIKPFKYGTTGQYNIDPRLSKVGRLICGRPLPPVQLPGQHSLSSSGLFSKNKQFCSVDFGSCDRCMEQDADRLSLPKFHLLNLQGRICCYLVHKRKVTCGCSNGERVCNEGVQCAPCRRTLDLVQRGFYKKRF